MNQRFLSSVLAAAILAASLLTGCGAGAGAGDLPAYQGYLYMTDTYSGKVYAYDPAAHSGLNASIAATGKNGTGEIQFYKGIGYTAVGFGTDEGVYYFDPSVTNPTFSKIGSGIAAQYFAFYSATKAYVSVASNYFGDTGGLYAFNPSNLGLGLTQVAASDATKYMQEVIVGPDGKIYVAENLSQKVLVIDPATDAVTATVAASASGTTGLVSGTYNGGAGVFVANTGGTIDFIPAGVAGNAAATTVIGPSVFAGRLVQLANGNLVATGYGKTYLVALSGASAAASELKVGGASFGSLDIAAKDGLVYVPVAQTSDYVTFVDKLYVIDANGTQQSYSPVSVMTSADAVSNIGFYE